MLEHGGGGRKKAGGERGVIRGVMVGKGGYAIYGFEPSIMNLNRS